MLLTGKPSESQNANKEYIFLYSMFQCKTSEVFIYMKQF